MDGNRIRFVCFDLGGVLLRIVRSWGEACERAGVWWDGEAEEQRAREVLRAFSPPHETGQLDDASFANRVAEGTGHAVADVERILDAWLIDIYPGTPEILDALQERGVTRVCLTNTNERHWRVFSDPKGPFGELSRIDRWFPSHRIGARKPDDAAYECVESALESPPAGVAFFDDRPENVDAARRRGWLADVIDPDGSPPAQVRASLRKLGVFER